MHMDETEKMASTEKSEKIPPNLIPFIGLRNLGNTCYLNSVLQVLYFCPDFGSELSKGINAIEKAGDKLIDKNDNILNGDMIKSVLLLKELHKLFCDLDVNRMRLATEKNLDEEELKSLSAIRPECLITSLRNVYPIFEPFTQQDAQECFHCILSVCKSAISLANGSNEMVETLALGDVSTSNLKVVGGRKLHSTAVLGSSENKTKPLTLTKQTLLDQKNNAGIGRRKSRKTLSSTGRRRAKKNEKSATDNLPLESQNAEPESPSDKPIGCFERMKRKRSNKHKEDKNTNDNSKLREPEEKKEGKSDKENNSDDAAAADCCQAPPSKKSKLSSLKIVRHKPTSTILSSLLNNKQYSLLNENNLGNDKKKLVGPTFLKSQESNVPVVKQYSLLENEVDHVQTLPNLGKDKTISKIHDFVKEMFQGELVTTTKCMECEIKVRRSEMFQDVSLPVKENVSSNEDDPLAIFDHQGLGDATLDDHVKRFDLCSLSWALSEFTALETIDGENKYFCDKCCRLSEGERSILFKRLPPVLTLHLKRFSTTNITSDFSATVAKITSAFEIPKTLKFSEWCDAECTEKDVEYDLFGVVLHSGTTITGGHYLSYVKFSYSETLDHSSLSEHDGDWLEVDDEHVRLLSKQEITKALEEGDFQLSSRSPYMLFYHRTDSEC